MRLFTSLLKNGQLNDFNELLATNFLEALKPEKLKRITIKYLSFSFDPACSNPFLLFRYLDAKPIFSNQELDELLLNSNYFNTMPDDLVSNALVAMRFLSLKVKLFTQSLFDRLGPQANFSAVLKCYASWDGLWDKLASFQDLNYYCEAAKEIDPKVVFPKLVNRQDIFSAEEIITFIKCLSSPIEEKLSFLLEMLDDKCYQKVIDAIFAYTPTTFDRGKIDFVAVFAQKNFEEKYNIYFLAKVKESKDPALIISALIYFDVPVSKELLDTLLKLDYNPFLLKILGGFKENDLQYFLAQVKSFQEINAIIIGNIKRIDMQRINFIYDTLEILKPYFQLSRTHMLKLLENGFHNIAYYVNKYHFRYEECLQILSSLEEQGLKHLVSLYGRYLLSKDKDYELQGRRLDTLYSYQPKSHLKLQRV